MSVPTPRPRDTLCAELRRLHNHRGAIQSEVLDRLTQLDTLDHRISGLIDELADSLRAATP